jgi:hypothetical protein
LKQHGGCVIGTQGKVWRKILYLDEKLEKAHCVQSFFWREIRGLIVG